MPRMVNTNAPRRLPALPTLHPSPLQALSDRPAFISHSDGLGDDLGYYGELSDTRQLWDPQPPFAGRDVTSANEFAQDSGSYGLQRLDAADATNWSQHVPLEYYSPLTQNIPNVLVDAGCASQYDGSVGYDVHASSTSPYTASSQLSETERSDSSSPVGFVAGQPLLWQALNNSANYTQHGYAPLPSMPQLPQHDLAQMQEHFQLPCGVPLPQPSVAHNAPRATDQPSPYLPHASTENLGECLTLAMLCDPASPGEKPNYPYPTLIRAAILGSPRKALTLQGIYDALEGRFDWFRENRNDKAWKNSIRHNLSLNKLFRRLEKPASEPGKGCYWTVDIAAGEGNKRERRRTKRAGLAEKTRRAQAAAADEAKARGPASGERGGSGGAASQSRAQRGSASSLNGQQVCAESGIHPGLLQTGAVPRVRPAASLSRDVLFDGAVSYPGQPARPQWPTPYMSMSSPPSTQGPPTWGTAPSPQAFGYLLSPGARAYGPVTPQFYGSPSSSSLQG